MEFTNQPIALPLPKEIQRCLGHGHRDREWCEQINNCARNVTLRHDPAWQDEPPVTCFRSCSSDLMAGYMPLEGFPKDDTQ